MAEASGHVGLHQAAASLSALTPQTFHPAMNVPAIGPGLPAGPWSRASLTLCTGMTLEPGSLKTNNFGLRKMIDIQSNAAVVFLVA